MVVEKWVPLLQGHTADACIRKYYTTTEPRPKCHIGHSQQTLRFLLKKSVRIRGSEKVGKLPSVLICGVGSTNLGGFADLCCGVGTKSHVLKQRIQIRVLKSVLNGTEKQAAR